MNNEIDPQELVDAATEIGAGMPPAPPTALTVHVEAFTDLVTALGQLSEPVKGGKVSAGQRRYTYLTLPDLLEAVRPVLAANRLAFTQSVWREADMVCATTTLLHVTGWQMTSEVLTQRCGPGVQDLGSVTTYLRRYSLATMVGLAGTDDDDAQHVQTPKAAPNKGTAPAPRNNQEGTTESLPPVDPETGEILDQHTPGTQTRKGYTKPTDPVTKPQLGKIHALLKDQGITDRDEALQLLASLARVGELKSSKDLTVAQAGMVIDELSALTKGQADG